MNEKPFSSGQRKLVDASNGIRPEPEYVDDVFEEDVYDGEGPVETGSAPSVLRSADDTGENAPEKTVYAPPTAPSGPQPEAKPKPVETPAVKPRIPHGAGRPERTERTAAWQSKRSGAKKPSSLPEARRPYAEPRIISPGRLLRETVEPTEVTRPSFPADADAFDAGEVQEIKSIDPVGPSKDAARAINIPAWIKLEDVLKEHDDLPEGSLILGVQDDGKPLVLALDDPSIGAVLIAGDSAAANRKHLRAVLASAERLNGPDLLQIDIISRTEESFRSDYSVLKRNCTASDPCVFEILGEYLAEIETRLRDEKQLPFRMLIIDEVDELTARLADDSLRFLRWMMRRGAQVGIRIFASIETDRLPGFEAKTYRAFDLRLYGKIREAAAAERYTEISPQVLKQLSAGVEGCFKLDADVIRFNIPEFAA